NLLVGNEENAPALEMTLLGATLEFTENTVVAITGSSCECKIGHDRVPVNAATELPAGAVLQCGSMTTGARCYLAVQGGFDVPLVMGSASTFVAAQFGGFQGRRLQAGDLLQVGKHGPSVARALRPGALEALHRQAPLRVTKGAQQDWFGPEAFGKLFSSTYIVSVQSNRSGLRLQGETVRPREQSQLLTDGIPLGAIQVPQDGQPIILFVDQQTTGGYPKIANVIMADMHHVGQLRPHEQVRFQEVPIPHAISLLKEQEIWLQNAFVT
ncbi:MAG TPA: biotin-dependent carboxyltransferase family protein, partial [Methylomirabilota bacterium]|nr:biotin-dependent carboxyltransferase family protein [Methylomirabilota bacterium]